MASNEFLFTICYIVVSLCFIAPPKEFVSAGLTVQNMLSNYLGSEEIDFTGYHLRRTTATVVLHSLLPLGYYIGLGLVSLYNEYDDRNMYLLEPGRAGLAVNCCLLVCVGIAVSGFIIARYWSWNKWANHPFAQVLARHGGPWRAAASSINIEFRRVNKFCSIIGGTSLYITDSWIVKCTTYKVHVAHKPDVHLSIVATEHHDISHESNMAVQYLNIQVASINPAVKPFIIRLMSSDYGELREKIQAPIRNARNIIIHQSLTDLFLEAFRYQVEQNERYLIGDNEEEPEPCIGCMQQQANIKLQKLCADAEEGDCVSCFCRPMWCLECMGKWFASRQDQTRPDTWMSCRSPCPTCRSPFCMLDVRLVLKQ